jgi:arylsulfatase A-like enzyme
MNRLSTPFELIRKQLVFDIDRPVPKVAYLFITVWCGLVAGLLEAGALVVRKHTTDPNHLYGMTLHFPWLIPVANLCIFLLAGALGCVFMLAWRGKGHWLVARGLCALTLWPMLLVAFPRIYALALLVVVLGIAMRLVPVLERKARAFWTFVKFSLPVIACVIVMVAAIPILANRAKESRELERPMPAVGSQNVVLIVLDTVAANHLSLNGYKQETSLTLSELAERGVCFSAARSSSSWSLPSHATMFTGRWLHELSAGWLTPLADEPITLAEFLGSRGYATAGFVANTVYCAADSGLARGFTRYDDFIFPALTAFKPSVLVNRVLAGIKKSIEPVEEMFGLEPHRTWTDWIWRQLDDDRKPAATVNQELLGWLEGRAQPERPFFAFLNYFDAHYPYFLPSGRMHRFGFEPTNFRQYVMLRDWFTQSRTGLSPREMAFASTAYDDCIADLDEQIGRLLDELESRGVLENTWVIITSDHGESFGEHENIFCHGTSLYQTEVHVPLLILPPGGTISKQVVNETVSLRDLAATIVNVSGQSAGSPFPGESLGRFWNGGSTSALVANTAPSSAAAELALPSIPPSRDFSSIPKTFWPVAGLTEGDWSYIRHEGTGYEELFHLGDDINEQKNSAADQATKGTLERMRRTLDRTTGGPLVPPRFSP